MKKMPTDSNNSVRPSSLVFAGVLITCLIGAASPVAASELDAAVPAPDPQANGRFGWSVALDGDLALIGEAGASFARRNRAHLVARSSSGQWTAFETLQPSGAGLDEFGGAGLALAGTIAIVGAPLSTPSDQGTAVVFELAPGSDPVEWTERWSLTPSSGGSDRHFGESMSLVGERVLVGAPGLQGGGLVSTVTGSVFVFEKGNPASPDGWSEVREIAPATPVTVSGFGSAVALLGDLAIIGSPLEDEGRGAVYVFSKDQGGADAWGQLERLIVANAEPNDRLGHALSATSIPGTMATEWIAVGAPGRGAEGAVVMLSRASGATQWTATELAEVEGVPGAYGAALDLDQDTLVVGNPNGPNIFTRGSGATGVLNVYRVTQSGWTWVARHVTAGNEPQGLGRSVAVSGEIAIAGAPIKDLAAIQDPGAFYDIPLPLFADGFESGSVGAWSSSTP